MSLYKENKWIKTWDSCSPIKASGGIAWGEGGNDTCAAGVTAKPQNQLS